MHPEFQQLILFFKFSAFNTCISSSDFDENKTQADKSCIAQAKALLDNLQSLNRDDTKYEAYGQLLYHTVD